MSAREPRRKKCHPALLWLLHRARASSPPRMGRPARPPPPDGQRPRISGVMRVGAAVGGQFRSPISRLHPGRVTQHPLFARPAGQVLPGRLATYAAAPTGHGRWLQSSWTFPVAICDRRAPATSFGLHFGAAKPSTAGRGKNATIAPRNSCPRRFWEQDANGPRDTQVCTLVMGMGVLS